MIIRGDCKPWILEKGRDKRTAVLEGVDLPGVERAESQEGGIGIAVMDAPETVAVPLPICRVRSGSGAAQGTSLGVRSQH